MEISVTSANLVISTTLIAPLAPVTHMGRMIDSATMREFAVVQIMDNVTAKITLSDQNVINVGMELMAWNPIIRMVAWNVFAFTEQANVHKDILNGNV